MTTLKLSPKQKIKAINTYDINNEPNVKELAELLKDVIPNIHWRNLVQVVSSYNKNKFKYRDKQELMSGGMSSVKARKLAYGIEKNIYDRISRITKIDPFNNVEGANKHVARNKMKNLVINSGIVGSILTLPHKECIIEQSILSEAPKTTFIACEKNKGTLNAMRSYIKANNLGHAISTKNAHGNISNFIYGVDKNTYAHMILDYCGTIQKFYKEISYTIKNNLVQVGGTISITLSPRNGHPSELDYLKKSYSEKDNRCDTERMITNFFIRECGTDYVINEVFNYTDDSNMILTTIKRVR